MAQLVITSVERVVLASDLVMCFQSHGVRVVVNRVVVTRVEAPLMERKVGPMLE